MNQDRKPLPGAPKPTILHRGEVFEGRETDVKQVLASLAPGAVHTLWGAAGMGKSALAAEAIRELTDGGEKSPDVFPDGVFIHGFHDDPTIDRACEAISSHFGGDTRFNARDAARRVLADKKALLVLDGTEGVTDLDTLLGMRGGCGVLITTRDQPDGPGSQQEVQGLASSVGLFAFQKYAGGGFLDPAASKAIVETLEGNPLALRVAGTYIKETGESVQGIQAWLESVDAVKLDEKVPLLVERSLEKVGDNGRKAFAAAGYLALQPFDRIMIAAVLGMNEIDIRNAISPVVRFGLFETEGGQHRVSHNAIHQFSANQMGEFLPEDALDRLGVFFAEFADFAIQKGLEGYGLLDEVRLHIMQVLERLIDTENWETANRLCWAIHDYMDIKGYSSDRLRLCEIGIKASRGSGHRRNEGVWLGSTGNAYYATGQVTEAVDHYQQALDIAVETDDQRNQGTWLGNLGSAYLYFGKLNKAIDHHEQALEIARETGDQRGEGNHLAILGSAHAALGKLPEAIEYFQQALSVARHIGDRHHEASWLRSLGDINRNLGQADQAVGYFEQSLEISRELGDRHGEGIDLGNLGIAYASLGRLKKAITRLQQALEIIRSAGDRPGEGSTLGNLGNVYADLGQVDQAIECHHQALAISRELGNKEAEANDLGNLGIVYKNAGEPGKARESWEQALEIFESLNSPNTGILRTWLSDLGK